MNIAVFGGFGERMLAPGWTKETSLALLGGGEFNLANIAPGDDARLTAVAIFGGIDIIVDQGTQVTMTGFSLFGSRKVTVTAGEGPSLTVHAVAIFGGVEVKTPRQ